MMISKIQKFLFLSLVFFTFENSYAFELKFSCVNFYDPTASRKIIEKENLSSVARYKGEWFEVAVPRFDGAVLDFVFRKTNDPREMESLVADSDFKVRQMVRNRIDEYVRPFGLIVDHFQAVADSRGAKMEARMKEFESFRDKLINQAKQAEMEGKTVPFTRIDDFNGVRLVTPYRSDLTLPMREGYKMRKDEVKEYYARLLDIPVTSIERVDIKGDYSEMIQNKFYQAIHLTLVMHGVPVEVQIMSESMAAWHHWDHPKVYKTKITDENYKQELNRYSRFWARLIRSLEENDGTQEASARIRDIIVGYGVKSVLKEFVYSTSSNWLLKVDQAYAERFGIVESDRILGSKSVLDPFEQMNLLTTLAQPKFL